MISEFFEDREIFLTGGSGVVGKALIEKLLRSCNVRKIYVLLRPKKNFTIEDRLNKIKKEMIFRRLLSEKPTEFSEKVIPIPGDVEQDILGISPDYIKLMENVSIIVHSAATIRFDESLKTAIRINVGGTLETLRFGETLKHLDLFMHVSTFFSNPYLEFVEAKWYDAPMDWKFCLDLCRRTDISEDVIDGLTKKLIVGFPNTYCFTKNLAEALVNDYRKKCPVAIYRPSIVVFGIDEPEPGFPPSLMGAMGLFAVAGAGVLKVLHMAKDQRLDMSPLDYAIKSLLYYIARASKEYALPSGPAEMPIFQITSCTHSDLTFAEYVSIMHDHKFWINLALEKSFLLPSLYRTDCESVYMILFYLQQLLPSLLVDLVLRMCGRRPELTRIQRKLFTTLLVMKPFLFNNYDSSGISCAQELKQFHGTDFQMDMLLQRPTTYYQNVGLCYNMVYKVREILFKEDPSTLPRSRLIMKTKIFLFRVLQLYLAYKLYYRLINPIISDWKDSAANNNTIACLQN